MSDLIAFIQARLDEDEQGARAATGGTWVVGPNFGGRDNRVYVTFEGAGIDTIGTCVIAGQVANMPGFRANASHIARHDPARVLREVEAKRRLLMLRSNAAGAVAGVWEGTPNRNRVVDHAYLEAITDVLTELATVWSDHPDYQAEWSP